MHNHYLEFVERIENHYRQAQQLPLGDLSPCPVNGKGAGAKKVMLFSPHPDDESITGLLPLRLMRQAGMKIINVPVTFGSNQERRAERFAELEKACAFLGWELLSSSPDSPPRSASGLQNLSAEDMAGMLAAVNPEVIVAPHENDWNSRHISTHHLVFDALRKMRSDFSCRVVETEFWGAMDNPNLMVEADAGTLADLVAAVSFHAGEVKRNPYHLSLPAWMQDNVRRGGELVGGQGGEVPDFTFATLYRLRGWRNGGLEDVFSGGRVLANQDDPAALL